MTIITARVKKRITADGLMHFKDHVPLGRVYRVDIDSREIRDFHSTDHGVLHQKDTVRDADTGALLPVELLELLYH